MAGVAKLKLTGVLANSDSEGVTQQQSLAEEVAGGRQSFSKPRREMIVAETFAANAPKTSCGTLRLWEAYQVLRITLTAGTFRLTCTRRTQSSVHVVTRISTSGLLQVFSDRLTR